MKKHIIGKVLAAFIFLLASSFLTLKGQGEVSFDFLNTFEASYGNPVGIGPVITLEFKVDPVGNVELVSSTTSDDAGNIALVQSWSNSNVGKTAYSGIFGGSFKLIMTSTDRMQTGWRAPWHGIGCQGTNQWRIDGGPKEEPEEVYFTLQGDVGIEFTSIKYNDISYSDGLGNFMIQDHDTKETHYFENISLGDVGALDVTGKYNMRYKTDMITISTDPTTGQNGAGGKLFGLEFNVVAPQPKPPAIASVVPIRDDSLSFAISDDIEILFDTEMDQAKTSDAVTISPAVSNRVDTWSTEEEGDLLTISYDDLELETWYTIVVSDAAEATNGLTMLAPDTIRFKTLPPKPTVVSSYPEFNASNVLPNTTMYIEFSKPMISDSVEMGIVFDPEITGAEFVWSDDRTTLFISADELLVSTMYFLTVGPPAMDDFFQELADAYVGIFTTAIATSVDNELSADLVLYPNPASDVIRAEGVDVASLKIYSISGHLIKEIHNSQEMSVKDISTGLYIVTVSDRKGNQMREMVIIK